jgi:hypothetical protein
MKELVDYIMQYDPAYPSQIRGATLQEITSLQKAIGHELPRRYSEFLLVMGKDTGSFIIPEGDFRLDRILKAYRHGNRLSPRYILIGFDKGEPPYHFYLECASPRQEDGHIVRADSEVIRDVSITPDLAFASLREMLFAFAFLFKRMSYLAHRKTFIPPQRVSPEGVVTTQSGLLEATAEVATLLGFEKLPYTGPLHLLFERGDAALYASKDAASNAFSAELATRDLLTLKKLKEVIQDHTHLA